MISNWYTRSQVLQHPNLNLNCVKMSAEESLETAFSSLIIDNILLPFSPLALHDSHNHLLALWEVSPSALCA